MVRVVAFDADDTLWHSQRGFDRVEREFRRLLAPYAARDELHRKLYETEMANLGAFGYGVKAFTLSLVETALAVSGGAVPATVIECLLDEGKRLLQEPVELLDGAAEAVEGVAAGHRLLLITKGDLLHQERKLAESGLSGLFDRVDIVSEKDATTYDRVITEEDVEPVDFLMVGNSLRSDVLPVLEVGGWAVHVPYPSTWAHEEPPHDHGAHARAFAIDSLAELPRVVDKIAGG